uniref:Uncharacterized protein n=1 Tax=Siphoviridae sp. ct2QJ10 TaxID=2825315 RepID=A0A8S5P9J9_9CAUD|nr:MAG TPA: hypothetical protein [Siphoviridae sp. ct2QJ10]
MSIFQATSHAPPVQYFSGASPPVSGFSLKPANLFYYIGHFLAFSALVIPPSVFSLKADKTCCTSPIANLSHQYRTVIPDRRSFLTVSTIYFLK